MSKKATEFQKKAMSRMYRGKEIFKPLNTGWIDENVACVREWVANIFFYRKGGTTIMIDAGYNYDRLEEKMEWLGISPSEIKHILITHQDTDHVGAVEEDSLGLFKNAKLYIGERENRYLTGEVRRRVVYHMYKLPQVTINNEKVLLHDGQMLEIDGIKTECFLVPGHTWGHMVYLIDDKYLFTGDTIWFGADGGYSFISGLAAYETLQTVMPKEEALNTVHRYVEKRAENMCGKLKGLLHIPCLYRIVPALFTKGMRKMFGEKAGFKSVERQTDGGVWRVDMLKCPYNDTCIQYGCPELCHCFCDSDDITYGHMHSKLIWQRTKTLGRGDDCCDFCIKTEGR